MRLRTEFLGIEFDLMDRDAVARWLDKRDAASPVAYVVTPNVDHLVRLAHEDDAVHRAYAQADLCLCDSRVLARLARLCGTTLPVAPGSDLVATLFSTLLQPGDRVAVIGGSAADVTMLRARHPSITILHHDAPMGLRTDAAARRTAAEWAVRAAARVTLLAVGSPQQELLANEIAQRTDARGTIMCIGASVEFLTGRQRRAPIGLRRLGLEWAWRLATNPRRLARRYLIEGPAIFPMVWRWRREGRRP
jgi:N-acetylglucosaminyldiphosphoundecaprenol N-acetyl-beta-D-mannosaminyltransferase